MGLQSHQTNDTDLTTTGTVAKARGVEGPVTVGLDNVGTLTTNPNIKLQAKAEDAAEWVDIHDFGQVADITFRDQIAADQLRLQITSAGDSSGTGDFYFAAGT